MDDIRDLNPIEWQGICQRVVHAFNPKRERILTASELRRRMKQGMEKTSNYRASGFLRGGGPELLLKEARAKKTWAQRLLGWTKPKRWRIKVEPAVRKWKIVGYEQLIKEAEQTIVKFRRKQRELGAELRPYSPERIRHLEEEHFEERKWRKPGKRTAIRAKKWRK